MLEPSLLISTLTISTIIVVSVWIVLEKRQPSSTLAWILALVVLPYLGLGLYLVFGRRRLKRRTRLRLRKGDAVRHQLPSQHDLASPDDPESGVQRTVAAHGNLMELAVRNADAPVTLGNDVRILCDASEAYPAIFAAIAAATRYIHLEYYTVQPDAVGCRLRDALVEKAKQGVQVCFLVDGVGSWRLGGEWNAPLHEAGASFAWFLPIHVPPFPTRIRWNFRNHRKLIVVDGTVGFTGGLNIGTEYEGKDKRLGHWRDTHLRISGPAVGSLERIFAEDWYFATNKLLTDDGYFPSPPHHGDALVQIIPSGPDCEWQSIHLQIFVAISTSKQRCYISTPYFVPDEAIRVALITAALRGVDVRLLVPSHGDLRLVRWAGRSYYGQLLRAGVRIYEYGPGFLHAKTLVVDGMSGTVGSANMDIRSFRLNFEVNAFVYSPEFAQQLEAIFMADLEHAVELSQQAYFERPLSARILEASARVLSPLL